MAILDELTAPAPMMDPIQAGPMPQLDPNEMEQRKSLWKQYLSDPNLRQAMLQTGIGLLRSPKMGEGTGDIAANALSAGASTLYGLREADRIRNMEAAKVSRETAATSVSERQRQEQIDTGKKQAGTQATAVRQSGDQAQKAAEQAARALDEAIRHNKSEEESARLRANAEKTRADAYAGAGGRPGQTPGDIQKVNILAEKFVMEGMDEVSAKARAVREIENSKGKTKADTARDLLKAAYDNPFNFKKLETAEGRQQLLEDALTTAEQIHKTDVLPGGDPMAQPVTPTLPDATRTQAGGGRPGGTPVGTTKTYQGKTYRFKGGDEKQQANWELVK